MKLLFLDIDGVLNSNEYAIYYIKNREKLYKDGADIYIDKNAVFKINELCEKYNVRLVISSSWRTLTLESTKKEFEQYKYLKVLNKYIVGITPNYSYYCRHLDEKSRGDEINGFLKIILSKDEQINNIKLYDIDFFNGTDLNIDYCIIDDDTDMLDKQLNNFVHINKCIGITDDDIYRIKNILNIVLNN